MCEKGGGWIRPLVCTCLCNRLHQNSPHHTLHHHQYLRNQGVCVCVRVCVYGVVWCVCVCACSVARKQTRKRAKVSRHERTVFPISTSRLQDTIATDIGRCWRKTASLSDQRLHKHQISTGVDVSVCVRACATAFPWCAPAGTSKRQ